MIDINWHELFGGASMAEVKPVYHVFSPLEKGKVLERVVADSAAEALEKAKGILSGVEDLFVTGPHEHVVVEAVADAAPHSDE